MTAKGTTSSQKRRRRIRSTSSGVYFLPGSIRSPRAVDERRPQRKGQLDGVSLAVGIDAVGYGDGRVEPVVVIAVLGVDGEMPRDRRLDRDPRPGGQVGLLV